MSIFVIIYFAGAVLLSLYGINCHLLTFLFKKNGNRQRAVDKMQLHRFYGQNLWQKAMSDMADALPVVTTQLPIYNERNVAERLIEAVAKFHYPQGKHEIQVLDDSTDETTQLIASKVKQLQQQGVDIHHIIRNKNTGFKAGALRHGLETARGELVAVFDADFLPNPDFLLHAVPFFVMDASIGFVQGRWGHLNPDESLITRLQSIGIDGHFMVEQSARSSSGLFLNFNGTAGVFRTEAILAAGNWQDDTLTEDMDLSYRIQLAGWGCRFLPDLVVPAEIPNNINAFKSQQFRWAKGSIQTAIKLLPQVLTSKATGFAKFQAIMHMTHYLVHPLMLLLSVLSIPVLLNDRLVLPAFAYLVFGLMLLGSCSGPSYMYLSAQKSLGNRLRSFVFWLPLMICFGCGLAVNNTRAVLEALIKKPGQFVRTPKNGFARVKQYRSEESYTYLIELSVGIWCLLGTAVYFWASHYLVGHFLLIYAAGFCAIGGLSWRHQHRI